MSNSELGFVIFVGAIVCQRLAELRRSRRNERSQRAQGAIEHAKHQMVSMKALHAAWIVAVLDPLMATSLAACGETSTPKGSLQ